jgi:multidrug transporter EmrE-like cation transporter
MNLTTLFTLAGLGVTTGDLLLGHWARTSNWIFLVIGLIFNVIGILFYANTLTLRSVGIATAIFLAINITAVSITGMIFFREDVSILQFVGIGLIVLAIVLIEI